FTQLIGELEGIYSGGRPWGDWKTLVDRYRLEGALVCYARSLKGVIYRGEDGVPAKAGWRAYSAYFFPSSGWALVYWDDRAMIWLRRGGPNDGLIARFAYEAVNPEDEAWQVEEAARNADFREALQRDLLRRAGEAPPTFRGAEMLG